MSQQNKLIEVIEEYQAKLREIKALEKKYHILKELSEYSVCVQSQHVVTYDYGVDEYATQQIHLQMATEIAEMLIKDGFVKFKEEHNSDVFGRYNKLLCAYVYALKKDINN